MGTGSARAGVLTPEGALLGRAECPIVMNRTDANHAEHDSEQIWQAVCAAVREAKGAAADPVGALRASGYVEKVMGERGTAATTAGGWGR